MARKRTRSGRKPKGFDRLFKVETRLVGALLIASGIGSFIWAIVAILQLDIIKALLWVGLGIFLGLLGIGWWFGGAGYERSEHRRRKRQVAAFWGRGVGDARGQPVVIKDIAPPPATEPEPQMIEPEVPIVATGAESGDGTERD